MMFLINNNIEFLPEQQVLINTETGTETGLNLVAAQLLVYLLQHADRICGRNELLDAVFTRNNSSASDGNLNRHIMVLRRAFTDVHCDADVIITVPRNGFKIGNVSVRPAEPRAETEGSQEYTGMPEQSPAQETLSAPARQSVRTFSRRYTILFCLSFCFCLAAAGYYFMAPEPHISRPDVSVFKTEHYLKCEITFTSGTRYFPPAEVISELTRQGETVNCREPVKITLWRNDTPTQAWRFTTLCDSLNKCRGIYVYTQK
ncbi:winged helix-turn-helix domain-containing protein [Klebsiella aerogenes]|uniref:winged helix-turn-helix domain-containing protein n=1 Tax=Klebsiella aerogenes TaxID=548 RepID=UPI001BD18540|nr:winged helix-turn-helix domain-containing protein [Klebsiella aerogenes]ELA2274011.1 winged helix-turn-helix domain-containing protein [Klebsiella aerogenes]HBW5535798.1 winged helix-turn-helix domain-containing protein [Klebsiella aerogenes]HCS4219210.1 winged helix-turn-helix domain-containing protein [Klebsiella aerogenes]